MSLNSGQLAGISKPKPDEVDLTTAAISRVTNGCNKNGKVAKVLELPRMPSRDWAFILGVYGASVSRPTTDGKFIIHNKDAAFLSELGQAIQTVAPHSKPHICKSSRLRKDGNDQFRFSGHSASLVRELIRVTDSSARVPWEALGTKEERLAYLRGYAGIKASVQPGGVSFYDSRKTDFIIEIAVMLDSVNLPPLVGECEKQTTLSITDLSSLKILLYSNILLPVSAKVVEKRLAKRDNLRASHSIGTYEAVMTFAKLNPGQSENSIAQRFGIAWKTVHMWLHDDLKPCSVKRREIIRQLAVARRLPEPDIVAYAYRDLNLDRDGAYEMGVLARVQ